MNSIVLNKKRLGVILIITGLMVLLLCFSKIFDEKIKVAALVQNNISDLKKYSALDGKLTYKLPNNWNTEAWDFTGNEILYHNDFYSSDSKIFGFIEVWNLHENVESFLIKSEENSKIQNEILSYNRSKIKIKDKDIYLVKYKLKSDNGMVYIAFEYFIPKDNGFVRMTFYTREDNYNETQGAIYEALLNTICFN
ncbi:MAG: hypothetical protein ACERKV_03250 [Clostridiaceae bacterium]